jgi:parvulin-like peptidyl-prolyl isomerase
MRKRAARAALPLRAWGGLAAVVLVATVGAGPLFASEGTEPPPASGEPVKDRVVVRVNGDPIMASEVQRVVAERVPNLTGHGELSKERLDAHLRAAVQQLVVQRLVLQAAKREGITVPDAEVAAEEARLRARFATPEAYAEALRAQGLDPARVRDGLREHLLGRKMEQRVVAGVGEPGPGELKAYYDAHPDKFRIPPQARVSYVLAPVEASAPPDAWERAKARLETLRNEVGEVSGFGDLRQAASGAPDLRAVELGWVHQGQAGLQEVDKAVFAGDGTGVLGPVWTLYGQALVYVGGRRPARELPFEELNLDLFKGEWIQARREERLKAWRAALARDAVVEFGE